MAFQTSSILTTTTTEHRFGDTDDDNDGILDMFDPDDDNDGIPDTCVNIDNNGDGLGDSPQNDAPYQTPGGDSDSKTGSIVKSITIKT